MNIKNIHTRPFDNQKPGTGGLRKQTSVFLTPNFLENFIQSAINVRVNNGDNLNLWVVGGDGRFPCKQFLPKIIKILIANGVKKVIVVGQDVVAPTPAISHIIRKYNADGGFILSASHNPAGLNGDFGIKVEMSNGGQATEAFTNALYANTKTISSYKTLDISDECALSLPNVTFINPIKDYVELMESLFDFDAIRDWFKRGNTFRFDAMNASTGMVAYEIFVKKLGAKPEWILKGQPMDDFGGIHPEPNPTYAHELYEFMMNGGADFAAACDGDGDRNMILGKRFYVKPSDSLAILTKYHAIIPYFKDGIRGVARSIPTSGAVDLVAKKMGIDVYKTPTGWKFFASLLDSGKINICGEESFGQGADYIREKDGIFAILFWLNILAKTDKTVAEIVREMWQENGRVFYCQYSFEGVDKDIANQMLEDITKDTINGMQFAKLTVKEKTVFEYVDPVTGECSYNQGIQIFTNDGARVFCRLSGTGTIGATIRFYIEKFEGDISKFDIPVMEYLSDVIEFVDAVFKISERFGKIQPTAVN
ncbi:MAG: alpha-D-glucose phosphate-specific phosphoglucomutase [Alphaproteobacteria bacterium]|nr:alpha-D-glucose phosphate-specific phosphoglucomutase [Alphaproteobacteria bacterium]